MPPCVTSSTIDKIYGKRYIRIGIVAGKCNNKIIAPLIYNDTMNSEFFEKWFKHMLLRDIKENQVIVMDNARFHRKKELEKFCEQSNKNIKLIFLPPYSPELNLIENYWAVLKRRLKKFNKLFDNIYDLIDYCL